MHTSPQAPYFRWVFCALLTLLGATSLQAQEAGEKKEGFPARIVEEVLIPVPGEIFAVLDKLGAPDWKRHRLENPLPVVADRERLALLFGICVAEGFIAVEAQDPKAVESLGGQLMRLASGLGLQDRVERHAAAVLEASQKEDWPTVRREFDKAEVTVRETLKKMRDEKLAKRVSLGGWLRGTQAVAGVISEDYSESAAELLAQAHIVEHFLSTLPEDATGLPAAMRKGLAEIGVAIKTEEGNAIEESEVKLVRERCTELVAAIAGWKTK